VMFLTYRYSSTVHLLRSQHHAQLWNDRRDSPKFSPKILRTSATQLSRNNSVISGFSFHRAETSVVSNLLGKLMFCH
jgi:hypothetical protein